MVTKPLLKSILNPFSDLQMKPHNTRLYHFPILLYIVFCRVNMKILFRIAYFCHIWCIWESKYNNYFLFEHHVFTTEILTQMLQKNTLPDLLLVLIGISKLQRHCCNCSTWISSLVCWPSRAEWIAKPVTYNM